MLGKFHHPGYPQQYHTNIFCYYQIVVPTGHTIALNMKFSLGLKCSDRLTFFDGAGVSGIKLGEYVLRKIISSLINNKFSWCGHSVDGIYSRNENFLVIKFISTDKVSVEHDLTAVKYVIIISKLSAKI